jgi:hypothetical protein
MSPCISLGLRATIILAALAGSLFGMQPRALALATEHFGNAPVPQGFVDLGGEALALANLKSRFYWYEVNGNPTFYYQGKTEALNEALKRFAALGGKLREVVLLPGPGEGHNLTGEKHFPYDWWVNIPAGLHREGPPTMTVYITAAAPATPPDARQLERWISDLDSDLFMTRDQASQELKKLGYAAAPALRKALAGNLSAEARRQIEQLLDGLIGIDLREVKMPAGVAVLEVKDLLKRYREQLKSGDSTDSGIAAGGLGGLARYADVIEDLIGALTNDKHEYVRRCAAGALSRLGKRAAPALPRLKAGLKDPDVNVRNAFEYAITQIEGTKEEKIDQEQARRQRELLAAISAFCMALPGR